MALEPELFPVDRCEHGVRNDSKAEAPRQPVLRGAGLVRGSLGGFVRLISRRTGVIPGPGEVPRDTDEGLKNGFACLGRWKE